MNDGWNTSPLPLFAPEVGDTSISCLRCEIVKLDLYESRSWLSIVNAATHKILIGEVSMVTNPISVDGESTIVEYLARSIESYLHGNYAPGSTYSGGLFSVSLDNEGTIKHCIFCRRQTGLYDLYVEDQLELDLDLNAWSSDYDIVKYRKAELKDFDIRDLVNQLKSLKSLEQSLK